MRALEMKENRIISKMLFLAADYLELENHFKMKDACCHAIDRVCYMYCLGTKFEKERKKIAEKTYQYFENLLLPKNYKHPGGIYWWGRPSLERNNPRILALYFAAWSAYEEGL